MLARLVECGGVIRAFSFLGLSWLEWIGLVVSLAFILYQIPHFFRTVYNTLIAPALGHYADLTKMGKWAVVTGATDGVGKAYAQEIARLGINIVLISRSIDKLKKVASEIEEEFGVDTRIIAVDFTDGVEIYDVIRQGIEGLEVGTLVNNVGMWYPYAEYFMELPNGDKYCQDLINCNVVSVTMMSRVVLPQMLSRGKGVIVNVGSFSSVALAPLMCVYGATKSYLDSLSQSLEAEYADRGIIIQTVIPGYVATKMSGIKNPTWTSPSPTKFVAGALKTIGVQKRTASYIPHRLAVRALEWYFFFFKGTLTNATCGMTKGLRARAAKKRALRNGSKPL